MKKSLTQGKDTIIVTGASGFIGSHLLEALKENYHIHALARRTQKEVGVPRHENIFWDLVDITDKKQLKQTFQKICSKHNVEYVIHLAAYYDFGDQKFTDIIKKTNIDATKYLLDLTKECDVKHFIFASSLVASNFPKCGDLVYEESELDADFPYALTKQKGEELVQQYSKHFPCSVVRFAAVFSDCCEYEPLYHFMKIWLSDSWKSRIIAGHGRMAIPYIHINCITSILNRIISQSDSLQNFNIFLASSDKPISLLELFTLSTRYYYGEQKSPIFVPIFISKLWVFARDIIGRLMGKRPFEKYWMTNYIDKEYPTDCSRTRQVLGWRLEERHVLSRRILYLIENLKSNPHEWHQKNLTRFQRFTKKRPSLTIYEVMQNKHEELVDEVCKVILLPENSRTLEYCQGLGVERLKWNINVVYNNLLISVRHGDRSVMINFGNDLAKARFNEGVQLSELCATLNTTKSVIKQGLYRNTLLKDIKLSVNDCIELPIQLAIDEIKETYDLLEQK